MADASKSNSFITRLLAVLALVAAALAIFIGVGSALNGGSDDKGTQAKPSREAEAPRPKTGAKKYTVKEGDNLSIIAERTGIPVDRLEELNPDLDPQALSIGQKLKLR